MDNRALSDYQFIQYLIYLINGCDHDNRYFYENPAMKGIAPHNNDLILGYKNGVFDVVSIGCKDGKIHLAVQEKDDYLPTWICLRYDEQERQFVWPIEDYHYKENAKRFFGRGVCPITIIANCIRVLRAALSKRKDVIESALKMNGTSFARLKEEESKA